MATLATHVLQCVPWDALARVGVAHDPGMQDPTSVLELVHGQLVRLVDMVRALLRVHHVCRMRALLRVHHVCRMRALLRVQHVCRMRTLLRVQHVCRMRALRVALWEHRVEGGREGAWCTRVQCLRADVRVALHTATPLSQSPPPLPPLLPLLPLRPALCHPLCHPLRG
jgi:hypothetical protein